MDLSLRLSWSRVFEDEVANASEGLARNGVLSQAGVGIRTQGVANNRELL